MSAGEIPCHSIVGGLRHIERLPPSNAHQVSVTSAVFLLLFVSQLLNLLLPVLLMLNSHGAFHLLLQILDLCLKALQLPVETLVFISGIRWGDMVRGSPGSYGLTPLLSVKLADCLVSTSSHSHTNGTFVRCLVALQELD